ncbi:MAG: AtpZ/AtpI family protein [Chitinophagaceae bacterium]
MPKPFPSSRKKVPKNFIQYTGLAFQMLAGIGIATWGGYQLDKRWKLSFPLWVIILPLAALAVILWKIIQETKSDG